MDKVFTYFRSPLGMSIVVLVLLVVVLYLVWNMFVRVDFLGMCILVLMQLRTVIYLFWIMRSLLLHGASDGRQAL